MSEEKNIIDQLKKGHHHALASVMEMHQDYVFSILTTMLYRHEAEEATQDTFIKVFRSIHLFKNQSKFTTWLYSIAYRTGLDYLRKRKDHQPLEQVNYHLSGTEEQDGLYQKDLQGWLNVEIGKLEPHDAALIRLYYLREYNIHEVAEITGLTTANTKVKLFRIRKIMKHRMSHLKLTDLIN